VGWPPAAQLQEQAQLREQQAQPREQQAQLRGQHRERPRPRQEEQGPEQQEQQPQQEGQQPAQGQGRRVALKKKTPAQAAVQDRPTPLLRPHRRR